MKLARWWISALGLGALAGACTSDLQLALDDKRCDANGRCSSGYQCNKQQICVRVGLAVDDGGLGGGSIVPGGNGGSEPGAAGGSSGGRGGRPDAGAASGGFAGVAGSSGGASAGGTPNDPDGGSGTLPDGGCIPTTVYHDVDGDGFGTDAQSMFACPSLEWVTVGGDCRDDQEFVNPGQQQYFAVGYPASGPGGVSFDYDCANGEQPDPNNETNDPAPSAQDCSTLLGLDCTGSGFAPVAPERSGAGIEPRCGSKVRTRCVLEALLGNCNAESDTLDESEAFRCR